MTHPPTQPDHDAEPARLGTDGSRGDHLHRGWVQAVAGVVFTGIGTMVVLIAMNVIRVEESSIHAPRWVLGVVGGIFGGPGVWIGINGIRGVVRRVRLSRRARQHPDEPWLGDYEWDRRCSRDGGGRRVIGVLITSLFLAVFALPFLYIGFYEAAGPWQLGVGGAVVALLALSSLIYGLYLLMRRLKYGSGRITYDRFPLRLGDTIEVTWEGTKPIGPYNRIRFTLRCIEEQVEVSGTGKHRTRRYVRYQRWADTFDVEGPAEHFVGQPIPLTFFPPGDLPQTDLRANPPRYWELDIHADTPGVDFRQRYLVPVYRPAVAGDGVR